MLELTHADTRGEPVLGGPGAQHEARVDVLAALANLTGHALALDSLPDGSRPDVAMVRPADRSLFLGDAKAAESAGCSETTRRLRRYTSFLRLHLLSGGSGVFALAVPAADRYDWLRVLEDVCAGLGIGGRGSVVHVIGNDCSVVHQVFRPSPAKPWRTPYRHAAQVGAEWEAGAR